MSLEAALDEERLDILAILEGRPLPSRINAANKRTASPAGTSATKSPVRSMLDVGDHPLPSGRNASIAGIGVGITSPNASNYRSMLSAGPSTSRNRSSSRTTGTSPPDLSRRAASPSISHSMPRVNLEKEYNFEILPTNEHGTMPKRVAQGGKRPSNAGIFGSADTSRSEATRQMRGNKQKSQSPAGMFGRSKSPPLTKAGKLNTNSSGLMVGPNTFVTDTGQLIDMSNAYRRLSDAALMKSGGSLAGLPQNKNINATRGEFMTSDGGVRLTEDYSEDEAVDSSGSSSHSSGEEDGWGTAKRRGRGRRRSGDDSAEEDVGDIRGRQPKSLLAAAEDERKGLVMANSKIVSLLDPAVPGIDKSDGKLMNARKSGIHPRTSYDVTAPNAVTPFGSDDEEELDDIQKAQRLEMNVSPVSSDPKRHRCIRQIMRGDYRGIANEAAQGLRRQRMYLVATDLSEEAAYALEWTIGTVLKDGDTLFAIYAAESGDVSDPDESARSGLSKLSTSGELSSSAVDIGEGATMMNDTAEMVRMLSNTQDAIILPADQAYSHQKTGSNVGMEPSRLGQNRRPSSPGTRSLSRAPPQVQKLRRTDFTGMSVSEKERWKSTEAITERCISLLRKTKLQVRVVIDVFHCKSPRHMITEVIDYLDPTLVILGSRGRSAIKGVLLGSFSNYLVTKSSVPVMVARKKLRKQSKSLRPNLRFSNVLQTPGTATKLEDAQIDKLITRDT